MFLSSIGWHTTGLLCLSVFWTLTDGASPDATAPAEQRNSHRPSAFLGWSEKQVCTRESLTGTKYCVYTSNTFADGRGVSILTSPEHIPYLTKLPAFQEPAIHSKLGLNQLQDPPFVATPIEGRGIGLIANRTIKRGEWLMGFTPVYMAPADVGSDLDYNEKLKLLHLSFQQLPSEMRIMAENLAVQGGDDLLEDVMDTNSFYVPVKIDNEGTEMYYAALFPETARLNHDCRPNAHVTFNRETLILHVNAFRHIFPGEELTISYTDPVQKRKARLRDLNRTWGFECKCSLCTASEEAREVSDVRIGKIIELQEELEDRFSAPAITVSTTGLSEQLITLYKQERLWARIHNAYTTAAIQYNGIGDAQKARHFAKLALRSGFVCRGPTGKETEYAEIHSLLDDPQNHESWMSFVQNLST